MEVLCSSVFKFWLVKRYSNDTSSHFNIRTDLLHPVELNHDSRKAEVWEKHSILVTVSQGQRRESEFEVYLEETGDRIETCLGLLQPRIMKQGQ